MGAETRLAVVLFGSFVLWIPALGSVLRGELDAGVAGIRWGVGAALVWAMVTALNQLIAGYAVATTEARPARRATDGQPLARRRADVPEAARDVDDVDADDHVADTADGGDTAEDEQSAADGDAGPHADAAAMETV